MDFELDEDFLSSSHDPIPAAGATHPVSEQLGAGKNGETTSALSRDADDSEALRPSKRPRLDLDLEVDQDFAIAESIPLPPHSQNGLSTSVQELMQSQASKPVAPRAGIVERPAFSVSNLDLGDGRLRSTTVSATTFDGKTITFKRKPQKSVHQLTVRYFRFIAPYRAYKRSLLYRLRNLQLFLNTLKERLNY